MQNMSTTGFRDCQRNIFMYFPVTFLAAMHVQHAKMPDLRHAIGIIKIHCDINGQLQQL